MASRPPRGVLGATGGALGALTLLPLARSAAARIFPLPRLPGAELKTGDIKGATYLEVVVLVAALPAAAFFFGHLLPRLLTQRAAAPHPLLEWPGAAFASAFFLWRLGARPLHGVLAALLISAVATVGALAMPSLAPFLASVDRRALSRVFLAGALWALAWRAAPSGGGIICPSSPAVIPVSGGVFALLALGVAKARREEPA